MAAGIPVICPGLSLPEVAEVKTVQKFQLLLCEILKYKFIMGKKT